MNSLGSTVLVTDWTGAVVEDKLLYPWGQDWMVAGTLYEERFAKLRHRDTESNLDPTPNRMFSSTEGRWLSPDPDTGDISDPQSLNRYAYALGSPCTLTDPLGLQSGSGGGGGSGVTCVYNLDGSINYCTMATTTIDGSGSIPTDSSPPGDGLSLPGAATPYAGVSAPIGPIVAPGRKRHTPKSSPCTAQDRRFFANLSIYQGMAKEIGANVDFIMALSAQESGWNGQHAQDLHNLFGVTQDGGSNLSFSSYQAGADYWVSHYGGDVKGANTIAAFTTDLVDVGYNNQDPYWYAKIVGGTIVENGKPASTIGTYQSVLHAEKRCKSTIPALAQPLP